MSDVLYVPEAAQKMGLTEAALRGHVYRRGGAIPHPFKAGRKLACRRATLDTWLAHRERTARRMVKGPEVVPRGLCFAVCPAV